MVPSIEKLLEIARTYWPSQEDPNQEPSPEAHLLRALWNKKLEKPGPWDVLIEQLRNAFPENSVGNITTASDACFWCAIYPSHSREPPGLHWVYVGCASIIAPVYTVYRVQFEYGERRTFRQLDLEPPAVEPAVTMSRLMESTMDLSLLPPDIANHPAPVFVGWKSPPKTTLFHALFTSYPDNLP
ncbi:hypothetical protein [Corallococcus carmarthensis]|uniref:Uncharacterized protein n=1 Tax=Corallococcus carmarthensis TaxID=2316728 RepID=A0A3A8K0L3_9BACT|nr:hypothetical protein [Corallococcus carmarthensis]RKH00679.1 hypothetical protein D7X32_22830 [Corallococcus carmarthensis]